MKRTIERITRTAMLAVAFMLCATSAWAATGDIVTLKNDSGFDYSYVTLTASDTYTISIPETQGLSNGDYVRLESFSYGMGSSSDSFYASVIKVTDYANNVITLGKANEYGGWTSSKFANKSWKQSFGRGDICILKVGETYNFQLLGSAGTATSQKVWAAEDTSRATSPVAQSTTDTNKRMTQEIVLTKLGGKPISATVNENNSPVDLTSLSWDEDLPEDLSQCPTLIIKVTGNATINIDSAITAYQVIFRVSEGATAKIIGAAIATSSGIAACGEGTVDLTEATFSGGVSGGGTVVINDSSCTQSIIQNSGLDVVTIKGGSYSGSWTGSPEFFTHTVFDGGSHSLTFTSAGGDYRICRNSSNNDPLWTIRNDTTLSIAAHDFGGYKGGDKASSCVIAVEDGGTLELNRSGNSTFYYQGRFLLNPGSTMKLGAFGDATKFRINGGTTSGQEQIYVPDQVSASDKHATIADISGDGTGRINTGNDGTVGIGVYVGSNAQLDCLAALGNGNGATPIVKRGAGVWKQSGSMSTYTGTLTVEAGTFALLNALDVNENMSLKFSAGTTLAIEETAKGVISDGTVTLKVTSDSAVPNIVVYKAGTTTPIPGATISKDNTNLTISYTPVSASGSLCWMDFEFNGNANSSGRLSAQLKSYVKTNGVIYYTDGGAAYMDCQPGTKEGDPAFTFPSEWTAVIRCKAPVHNNDKPMVLLMCGNGGSELYDDLVGVVVTKDGEIGLALKDGVVSSPVSVDNVSSAQHTYIIRKSSSKVALYIDGELSVETDATPAPAGAFQVGCVWKNLSSHSIYAPCASFTQNGQVDYLRFFDCALGDNMLAAIMSSNPWPSVTLDNVDGTDWSALSWSDDFDPDGNTQVTVASASSIEVGSATTIGMLKLVGSADLTIANIGNLTVTEFDLSDYTGNLTLSVDSVATATTWKFTGSADVTVVSSAKLTLGTLDLSEYSGSMVVDGPTTSPVAAENALSITTSASLGSSASLTVSHNALVLANGVLTGAGTLYLDPGEGNTYTMSQSNTGYTGEAVIKSGTVKMGDATSFGPLNRSAGIRVKGGATLSSENATSNAGIYAADDYIKNKAVLEEGATLIPYVANDPKMSAFSAVTLVGDAKIDATSCATALGLHYNWTYSHIDLGECTLTKIGANNLHLSIPKIEGTGTLYVKEGSVSICDNYNKNKFGSLSSGKLKVDSGASFNYINYNGGVPTFTVKDLELDGIVTRVKDASTLTVTGYAAGTGTTPMLTLADGATLKPQSSTGGLRVTSSLTLSGHINVDLSEIDLTGKSKLAIITSPLQIDKDTQVETFTRGSNSEDWVLYSEEVSTGLYELGVKLNKTIESSLSWSGSSGTWSANGFNAVEDSFYNDANQTVVFADDAGSSSDPLAVAVSGDKTVNALNFTADNRNVTLSGDAITAASISKSGAGAAVVNSTVAVNGTVTVTDGILVINPTSAVVSDLENMSSGTLVVYVGDGDTFTIANTITATKLIKRGAGTLALNSANSISNGTALEEGKILQTGAEPANTVAISDGAVFTLQDVAWTQGARFTGERTAVLELDAATSKQDHTATLSPFNGIVRLKSADVSSGQSSQCNLNPTGNPTFSSETRPELIFNGYTHLGNQYYKGDATTPGGKLLVRNLSGNGRISAEWTSGNYYYCVETKQTKDTEFTSGFWSSASSGNRVISLGVIGDNSGKVHSLTLSGAINTYDNTATQASKLTVADDGQVVFAGTGSWKFGEVVVEDSGWLSTKDSTSDVHTKNLTLKAGSILSYKNDSTAIIASGTLTLPESGTVTIDVDDLTIAANASKTLLSVGSGLNINKFSQSGNTATHMLDRSGQKLNLVPIAATLTKNDDTVVPFATVQEAVNATINPLYYGYKYITVNVDDTTVDAVDTKLKIKYGAGVSSFTVNSPYAEYASDGGITDEESGITTYSLAPAATEYTWSATGEGVKNWITPANWTYGSGTLATRCPTNIDSVVFNDGATVTHGTVVSVAGIAVNGAVSVGGTSSLETYGAVTGSGILTIASGGFASAASGITVAPAVVFGDGTYISCASGGDAITFNGDVSLPAGEVKFWNAAHSFAGTTTINGNFNKGGNQTLTLADVNVAASSTLSGAITITGSVTVDSGKSLGIPSSGVTYSGARFVGAGSVSFASAPVSELTFGEWTGTVVIPAHTTNTALDLNYYGVSGSTVEISGMSDGWLTPPSSGTVVINPNLRLTGNMVLDDMSERDYSFQTISGIGSFSVTSTALTSMSIAKIGAGYEGTISNTSGRDLTITAVDMATVPAVGDRLLKVSGDNITISGVTVNGVATPLRWVRKTVDGVDGFYVISGTIFSVW